MEQQQPYQYSAYQNQNQIIQQVSAQLQGVNISYSSGIQQKVQGQKVQDVKNKQDQEFRRFRGDITKFIKSGRGWFPFQLPQTILQHLLKQCPNTGLMRTSPRAMRIMSYNILATSLSQEFEYGMNDPDYIKWERRFPDLQAEIKILMPDILCLQETEDHTGMHDFLKKELKYEGVFYKKPDITKSDGVAIFYKPDKYILQQKFEIPFNFNPDSDLYFKPNNSLILALQPIALPERLFLIASTHIYFNMNRGDTKIAQLKFMTDSIAQLKTYYEEILKKKVSIFIGGDFNSGPRSGIYDFMRQGEYDCFKMSRNEISGQFRGAYKYDDRLLSTSFHSACSNPDVEPTLRDEGRICEWFTEITHTYPELQFDDNMQPITFVPKNTVPFEKISMKIKKPTRSAQCEEYLKLLSKYVNSRKLAGESEHDIVNSKARPFMKLKNNCGPFKSAYAQNMLNQIHYINQVVNNTFPIEYLDYYQKESDQIILEALISQGGGFKSNWLQFYLENDEVYGGYKWHKPNTYTREWLKKMACMTKEPCYTGFTNIKLCVDYIFYQGDGISVARVLEIPSFNRYLKDHINCIPNPMIPSDHFSIVADFIIE